MILELGLVKETQARAEGKQITSVCAMDKAYFTALFKIGHSKAQIPQNKAP